MNVSNVQSHEMSLDSLISDDERQLKPSKSKTQQNFKLNLAMVNKPSNIEEEQEQITDRVNALKVVKRVFNKMPKIDQEQREELKTEIRNVDKQLKNIMVEKQKRNGLAPAMFNEKCIAASYNLYA